MAWLSAARPLPAADAPTRFERARAEYVEGWQLARQGQCERAIPHFQRSNSLRPSTAAWHDLAECHSQLGQIEEACDASRHVLLEGSEPPALPGATKAELARYRQAVERRLARARQRIVEQRCASTRLRLRPADGPDAIGGVQLDGEPVPSPWAPQGVSVEPGRHQLSVERDGAPPWARMLDVGAEPSDIVVEIPHAPSALAGPVGGERETPRWRAPEVLVAAGVTAAAGVGWVWSDRRFAAHWERYRRQTDLRAADAAYRDAVVARDWGRGFAVATGVGALTTAALYFFAGGGGEGGEENEDSSEALGGGAALPRAWISRAWVSPSGGGITLRRAF